MNEPKFTAGPWRWDGNVCNYDPDQEAPWLVTCDTTILQGEITCNNPADARIIAVAPDMYRELEKARDVMLHIAASHPHLGMAKSINEIDRILLKARGETKTKTEKG